MDAGVETARCPWNKDEFVGQKLPMEAREIWAVRFRLQLEHRIRDLALFNPAAVQLLPGRTRIEGTVRYLGVEIDDALEIAEQTDA